MLKKKKKKKQFGGLPGGLGKNGISTALHLKYFDPLPLTRVSSITTNL